MQKSLCHSAILNMDFDSPDSTVVCILDAKCLKPFIIFPFYQQVKPREKFVMSDSLK